MRRRHVHVWAPAVVVTAVLWAVGATRQLRPTRRAGWWHGPAGAYLLGLLGAAVFAAALIVPELVTR